MRRLAKPGSMDERMDVTLNRFRSRINSYPPGMCPLVLYRSILQMSLNQSCGKCVPCRDGLAEVDRLFGSVLSGDATAETLAKMKVLCGMIAQTADCAVGVVAANTVLDSLREFADEYESHIRDRRCVENVVQTVPCMTLCPAPYRPAAELPDAEYPFILTTGRILSQYNAASMTLRSPGLAEIDGKGFIEMNTADAERLGVSDGDTVRVTSRRGSVTAAARVGRKVSEGETWMPFHFPDSPVNMITNAALDEFARIPEYKVCAVRVDKI